MSPSVASSSSNPLRFGSAQQLEDTLANGPTLLDGVSLIAVAGRNYHVDSVGRVTEIRTFCQRLRSCFRCTEGVQARERHITDIIQDAKIARGLAEYEAIQRGESLASLCIPLPQLSVEEGTVRRRGLFSFTSTTSQTPSVDMLPPCFAHAEDLQAVLVAEPNTLAGHNCVGVGCHLYRIDTSGEVTEIRSFRQKVKDFFTGCCGSKVQTRADQITRILQQHAVLVPATPTSPASPLVFSPVAESDPVFVTPPPQSPKPCARPLSRRVDVSDTHGMPAPLSSSSATAKQKADADKAARRASSDAGTATEAAAVAAGNAASAQELATAAMFLVSTAVAIRAAVTAAQQAAAQAENAATRATAAATTAAAAARVAARATHDGVTRRALGMATHAASTASSAAAVAEVSAEQAAEAASELSAVVERAIANSDDE